MRCKEYHDSQTSETATLLEPTDDLPSMVARFAAWTDGLVQLDIEVWQPNKHRARIAVQTHNNEVPESALIVGF